MTCNFLTLAYKSYDIFLILFQYSNSVLTTGFVILGLSKNLFLSLFYEQKSNQKTLVFDFRRSKLVSVIQCFKSFASQTVKHFNHSPQLFDTRLQII